MMVGEQHDSSVSDTPTLFLSFGGVLNVGHGLVDDNGVVTLDSGRPPFEYAPYLVDVLTPWPQVQIILTTSWLRSLGDEKTIALLPDELRRRVMGTTLHASPRFDEIKDGTAKTMTVIRHSKKRGLTKWLALDDEACGVPPGFEQHFLHTDSETALGAPEARKQLRRWLAASCRCGG
ncbi:HAD domain-containing protein [Paraburkholderia sp. FT54]|uniref:HAD domain-containing protein n=1 Tax=Paraburkholderia sp. FT54 TaxID=3074437 RepID=UPI002877F86E|nr:HAD domain-containing protein [Paraburkholderia sp. FT54]WNC90208.1 HAD domain-containing protein [Paraburkholderia sp. FT54]